MPFLFELLTIIIGRNDLSIAIDSTDIWWIILIGITGFIFCACCCMSMFLNFLRPWRHRRRGLPPPPRRGYIRWWRRYPPGPRTGPRRRPFRRPPRGGR